MKHLHDGHRERIRKRIQQNGVDSLMDHEVLEWLLFHTIPREDVNALAHRLIHEFGSFHDVLEADYNSLLAVEGVGEVTATFLSGLLGVEKRYHTSKEKQNVRKFRDLKDVLSYLRVTFITENKETLHALLLNKDMHLIRDEVLAQGAMCQVDLDLRTLTAHCLNTKATYLVLAHNHPSGFALPSSQDLHQTAEIVTVLQRLDVKLLDHIIITGNDVYSMRDSTEYSYMFF